MDIITIDRDRCIGCGECAADCVMGRLSVEDGKAAVLPEKNCIACGHCYAICPAGAVSMAGAVSPDASAAAAPMSDLDADRLLLGMESRRSVRRFTGEPLTDAEIKMLLDAGRFAPTGGNRQGVHFVVLREKLAEAERLAVEAFSSSPRLASLLPERGAESFFFKGAPAAIVVAGKRPVDPALASSYMELLAQSMGLGVFYSGYFIMAAEKSAELRALLGLPTGVSPVTALVLGHTDVSYRRLVPRQAAKVIWK